MTSHTPRRTGSGPLQGKIALVTGASRRIGRAIAMTLAEAGADIVAHERGGLEPETLKVCEELAGCGARTWKLFADLEKPEEYGSLISRAIASAGPLDILVNNASLFQPDTLLDMNFAGLSRHLHVNAWAPFALSREFARLAGRGKIVNILDARISGKDRTHAAYHLSKRLLAILTKLCAEEFAPDIAVNAVAPGAILPPAGKDEAYLDRLARELPLKRHGKTEDVANAVLYLLTSDFVTGQTLFVDGGLHLGEEKHGPHTDS
jgi:pteridine reductase